MRPTHSFISLPRSALKQPIYIDQYDGSSSLLKITRTKKEESQQPNVFDRERDDLAGRLGASRTESRLGGAAQRPRFEELKFLHETNDALLTSK